MKFKSSYEINISTLAILPILKNVSKIYEKETKLVVIQSVNSVINSSCNFFGSSLVERQKMTKRLIGSASKAPVIIEESRQLIFFPTKSPRETTCMWISFNNIIKYVKESTTKTRIVFKNNEELVVPISYNIVDNQITRCMKLEKELNKRRKSL